MSSATSLPVVIAQWSRNARDTIMVRIDRYNGNWSSTSAYGGHRRPGNRGRDQRALPCPFATCLRLPVRSPRQRPPRVNWVYSPNQTTPEGV